MKTLLTTLNAKYVQSSLALRCLRTACRHAGRTDVVTAEYTINHNAYDILRHIYQFHAEVIGFSCYIWNIEMTCRIITLIRQVMPHVRIFVGGPEVSYTARDVLADYPDIDYVLQGEGEVMVPAFLQALDEGRDGTDIPGVLGRVAGEIRGNETFAEVADLDTLPFPYEGEDFSRLAHKIIYYESSRGCPFHCQYCLSGMSDTVRFRSVPLVLSELEQFVAAGVHQVKFVDRTFNCNPRHHRPLIEYMIHVQQPVNFHLEIEPGVLTDADLDLLTRAPKGRIQLEMGIQSTYEPTLKAIHRHNDWPRITAIMKKLTALHTMHLHLDLIVGLPYEDYDHLQQSFNDIYALRPDKLQIGFLKLLKGSGIRRDYPDDYRYDPCGPYEVLATTWLSYEKVQFLKVLEDVFERTYNSGKFFYTLRYLERFYPDNIFRLYEAMTWSWLKAGNDRIAVADKALCQFLWDFICHDGQIPASAHAVLQELLSLDMLITFRFRLLPDFLGWQEAPRKDTDSLFREETRLRQYTGDYRFTNWRDIKMRYRIWPVSEETKDELSRYCPAPDGVAWIIAARNDEGVSWQMMPAVSPEWEQTEDIRKDCHGTI